MFQFDEPVIFAEKIMTMKLITFLCAALILTSCSENTENSSVEVQSKLSQGTIEGENDNEQTALTNGSNGTENVALGTTTLSFDIMEHDFGNVQIGKEYTKVFKVTNTGKNPLKIESAKASCGCTVPDSPKEPIAPGKSDNIVVKFSPKPGQGKTTKTITVTANTDPAVTMLKISANVIESMKKDGEAAAVLKQNQ